MTDLGSPDAAQRGETGFHERRIVVALAVIELLWIAAIAYGLSLIL